MGLGDDPKGSTTAINAASGPSDTIPRARKTRPSYETLDVDDPESSDSAVIGGHRDADRAGVRLKEVGVMAPGRINLSVADARDLAESALRGGGFDDGEARIIGDH